jgi:MORN repeat
MGNCMLGSMCLKPESVDNTKTLTNTQTPTDQIKKAELFQTLDKPAAISTKATKASPRESKQSTDRKKKQPQQLVKDSVDSGSEDGEGENHSIKEIVEEILTDKKGPTSLPIKFRAQNKTNSKSDQNVMKTHISTGDVVDFSSFREGQHEIFTSEVPTSFGKIRLENNAIYEGEWLRGQRNGYGVLTWPNGVRYEVNIRLADIRDTGKIIWPKARASW